MCQFLQFMERANSGSFALTLGKANTATVFAEFREDERLEK